MRLIARLVRPLQLIACSIGVATVTNAAFSAPPQTARRPSILLAISDDQSYPYASAYGCPGISTPAFDRVAREGVLFTQAFAPSPGCSPTRASILTGRYPWQNEHAGTHASSFSATFTVYPQRLEAVGYHVGMTGKGWGPGNFKIGGFLQNPAGHSYDAPLEKAPQGVRKLDYSQAFAKFLSHRQPNQPFCFWYGGSEPHRAYDRGIGQRHGGDPSAVHVPAFLPDHGSVREDILDYCFEIQWFDRHLANMLQQLEDAGELEHTIVVVTSDNGMPFPRAKANLYEYGIHVPLAVRWGDHVTAGRTVDDLVNLVDLMPTFIEACGLDTELSPMTGRSLIKLLESKQSGRIDASRDATYAGRERHSSSRWNNLGYPQRCVRTERFLYIRNFRPHRWPAGAPQKLVSLEGHQTLGPMHAAYHDIDASPTLALLADKAELPAFAKYLQLAVQKRPAEELYDVMADPACLYNLADQPELADTKQRHSERLEQFLLETRDPRIVDGGEIFESYRRYSPLREFPEPD